MTEEILIQRIVEEEITPDLDARIVALQRAAFPEQKHFETKRWVHTLPLPEDCWFHAWRDEELIGNVWVHHRTLWTSEGPLRIGGIANVCSAPAERGRGAAKACMLAANRYLKEAPEIDFGLLFCGMSVRPFYESLNWYLTSHRYVATQPDGTKQPVHPDCQVMAFDASGGLAPWPEDGEEIDLGGPEW